MRKRKQEILTVAAKLFREKTYLGTTIDDIASKIKINKATIYFYFENKEQILYEIISTALIDLTENAKNIISTDASPMKKLESLIKMHLKIGIDSANLSGISQFERKNLSPKLLKNYNVQRDSYEQIFRELIKDGIAEGQFRRCDPKMTSRLILSMSNSVLTWFKKNGTLPIEQFADELWSFVIKSLQNFK